MKKSKRIAPVAELAHNAEREAARAIGTALQLLERGLRRLDQLYSYRDDYIADFERQGQAGMTAIKINDYRVFMQRLNQAITAQEQVVANLRADLETKKRFWFSKRGRSKALDKVLERYSLEESRLENRREQRESDDRQKK